MDTTWLLIAHRAGARLYAQHGRGRPLELVEEIDHPDGRLQNREIDADERARAFDRVGEHRHATSPEEEPTERVSRRFARQLADRLKDGRVHNRCTAIVLAANPRFLGHLREALDKPTADIVSGSLDKDLQDVPVGQLSPHLEGLLRI